MSPLHYTATTAAVYYYTATIHNVWLTYRVIQRGTMLFENLLGFPALSRKILLLNMLQKETQNSAGFELTTSGTHGLGATELSENFHGTGSH